MARTPNSVVLIHGEWWVRATSRPRLLDERQLFPCVCDHVRRAVDDTDAAGNFLLTGSATPTDDARRSRSPWGATVRHFHAGDDEVDAIVQRPDGTWGGIEGKLGCEELVDRAAASLLDAVSSMELGRAGPPRFLAVVTAFGQYAYRREDGGGVVLLAALAP